MLPTPVAIAATPDEEELDAAEEAAFGDAVVIEPDPPSSPAKLCWLVQVASTEVALAQLLPMVLFEPLTKLTGAHCHARSVWDLWKHASF